MKDDIEMPWWSRYAAIIAGSPLVLLMAWPLILWSELIVYRNHIESETDMIAVYLFITQVATMVLPSCSMPSRAPDILPLAILGNR